MKINDNYVDAFPTHQQAIDLFQGDWASAIPQTGIDAGSVPLFEDGRINWLVDRLGGLRGFDVLELGPLEGGHTHMLLKAQASKVVAIEANTRAFLRCLIIKNIFEMNGAQFFLGNFDKYLETCERRYDLLVASGVLYHLSDPIITLKHMCRCSKRIFVWSHFFDEASMPAGDSRRNAFTGDSFYRNEGEDGLTYYARTYGDSQLPSKFCGGIASGSIWLDKNEVVEFFEKKGFSVEVCFEHPDHPNGPACGMLAVSG